MEQCRKSPRSKNLDYDSGSFFVTVCTADRRPFFGKIINGEMVLSIIGRFVDKQLRDATAMTGLEVPLWVVMPEHIHAIVCIPKILCPEQATSTEQRAVAPPLRANQDEQRYIPVLSRYMNSLKGTVTKFARQNNIEFGWQSRYNDHFIRNNRDGNNISEYILNNIAKRWDAMRHKG